MSLPTNLAVQVRDFNDTLDLSSLETLVKQLAVDRSQIEEAPDDHAYLVDAPFFGAAGRFTYFPKAADGRASRLWFHAETNSPIRMSKAALLLAFPSSEFIDAGGASGGVLLVHNRKNIIRFLADTSEGDDLDVTCVMISARDGSGAFAHSGDKTTAGAALPIDAIRTFATAVDLCTPSNVLARLGLTAANVEWLHGREDTGCFAYSGRMFGSLGRLSYSQTIGGAELSFLIGEDRVPTIAPAALQAAFPSLVMRSTPGLHIAREGATDILFGARTSDDGLLMVTGIFFQAKS